MLQYLVQQLAGELETVEGEKLDKKQIFRAFGAIGRRDHTLPRPPNLNSLKIKETVHVLRKVPVSCVALGLNI